MSELIAIRFFVPGTPEKKGSSKGFGFIRKSGPRAGSIGVNITNDAGPKAKTWAALVSSFASTAMAGRAPLDGPVRVEIVFHLLRPKGHFGKRGLKPSAPKYPAVKPDGDKMVRCAWDALSGVVFCDDRQVVEWPGGKVYAVDGRVGAAFAITPLV